jgi:hypothetical protein
METTKEIQKPQMKIGAWVKEQVDRLDKLRVGLTFLPTQIEDLWVEPLTSEVNRDALASKLEEAEFFFKLVETDLTCANEVQKTAVAKPKRSPLTFDVNGEPVALED